ncbi:hypothetical protein DLAC_08274 [Tieghemostelium lacteum]|uniref:Uncharacterized protein n=1 Tax=Tieghemostelium lacteum TaxID=361077 RepID=A0A151ZBL2_TIELA|nr:hypothetical protein DLAC_08274 [Tieghemostelium lacteum]|eukprot:KYQ91328.1 hypothetical protein DLAC_08274 [Tieghemostelium lacteum]
MKNFTPSWLTGGFDVSRNVVESTKFLKSRDYTKKNAGSLTEKDMEAISSHILAIFGEVIDVEEFINGIYNTEITAFNNLRKGMNICLSNRKTKETYDQHPQLDPECILVKLKTGSSMIWWPLSERHARNAFNYMAEYGNVYGMALYKTIKEADLNIIGYTSLCPKKPLPIKTSKIPAVQSDDEIETNSLEAKLEVFEKLVSIEKICLGLTQEVKEMKEVQEIQFARYVPSPLNINSSARSVHSPVKPNRSHPYSK